MMHEINEKELRKTLGRGSAEQFDPPVSLVLFLWK